MIFANTGKIRVKRGEYLKQLQERGFPDTGERDEWFIPVPGEYFRQRRVHLIADFAVPPTEHPKAFSSDKMRGRTVCLSSSHLARGSVIFAEERFFTWFRNCAEAFDGADLILTAPETAPTPGDLAHRGIRGLLKNPALFEAFLRAAYRISALARISLLFPFVNDPEEAPAAQQCAQNAMRALLYRREPFDETVETGFLIETPAAALGGQRLLADWGFAVVNTTTLATFALALPAGETPGPSGRQVLLRLVEESLDGAQSCGRFCGVSGFLANEPESLSAILGYGANALFLQPEAIPAVSGRIRHYSR